MYTERVLVFLMIRWVAIRFDLNNEGSNFYFTVMSRRFELRSEAVFYLKKIKFGLFFAANLAVIDQ